MTELQIQTEVFAPIMTEYVFYLFKCKNETIKDCYIGKTTNFLQRKAIHKYNWETGNCKLYLCMRQNGGWDNWEMEPVHRVICSHETSCFLEESFMLRYATTLNMHRQYNYARQSYNKGKCREHYAVRFVCACGWEGSKMNKTHHLSSKAHQKWANAPLCSVI
jgi:hypothetical protein